MSYAWKIFGFCEQRRRKSEQKIITHKLYFLTEIEVAGWTKVREECVFMPQEQTLATVGNWILFRRFEYRLSSSRISLVIGVVLSRAHKGKRPKRLPKGEHEVTVNSNLQHNTNGYCLGQRAYFYHRCDIDPQSTNLMYITNGLRALILVLHLKFFQGK